MTSRISDLADFGWNSFFDSQLEPDDPVATVPVRVMAVHRGALSVAGPGVDRLIRPFIATAGDEEAVATAGDWLLLDRETLRPRRLLQRKSLFMRRAAGTGRKLQLIAANVDTLFIVSSCNQDFNTPRLERYLAWARAADVTPVIVLTKADLTDAPENFVRAAAKLLPGLLVEALDARDPDDVACLSPWCARGQTVALVGSSGVGKSTLINTLTGIERIATQDIRDDDDKGRHTTSGRALYRLPTGGWLLDTPGMRELPLTEVRTGLEEVFADIATLVEGVPVQRLQTRGRARLRHTGGDRSGRARCEASQALAKTRRRRSPQYGEPRRTPRPGPGFRKDGQGRHERQAATRWRVSRSGVPGIYGAGPAGYPPFCNPTPCQPSEANGAGGWRRTAPGE